MRADVIAPPPGELFCETNDNSVAILLTYGTARILLARDAEARKEEYMTSAATRGLKRLSTFESTKQADLRFRAVLAEDGDRMLFHREGFDRLGEVSAYGPC